jgi:hypothetical protein
MTALVFLTRVFIKVKQDDQYTFFTSSDDGSKLYIGDTLVVDNDGLHGMQEREGTIGLRAGKHAIRVDFFEKIGGEGLCVSYAGSKLYIGDTLVVEKDGLHPMQVRNGKLVCWPVSTP